MALALVAAAASAVASLVLAAYLSRHNLRGRALSHAHACEPGVVCARAPQSDAVAEILRSFPDGAFVVPAESVGLSVIRALLEVAKPGRAALRSSGCHAGAAWLVLSARSSSRHVRRTRTSTSACRSQRSCLSWHVPSSCQGSVGAEVQLCSNMVGR